MSDCEKKTEGKRRAAFFDFDRTLIPGDSQDLETRFRIKNRSPGCLYFIRVLGVLAAGLFYKRGLISPEVYNWVFLRTYGGIPMAALRSDAEIMYGELFPGFFYQGCLDLLEAHRKKGDLIVIVSATSEHLLDVPLNILRPHHAVSTRLETTESGICTGEPHGSVCIGGEKKLFVERLAREEGIDLGRSYAYSDHHADLPFLKSVGNPVVVNPTRQLFRAAEDMGWPVKYF